MDTFIHVMGVPRSVNAADEAVLAQADLVVGSPRQCSLVPLPEGATVMDWKTGFDAICGALAEATSPVVLASGDPGFFGIVRKLTQQFPANQVRVHPAVSSVAAAFGRVGLPWTDAVVASAHGRDARHAIALARAFPKVAILTSPDQQPQMIYEGVRDLGRTVKVVADLGGPNECMGIHRDGDEWPIPNVAIVVDEEALEIENSPETESPRVAGRMPTSAVGLPEMHYEHRNKMITKAEVRALIIAWLSPGPGQIIWDIGCGSGSVAIEAASTGAAVCAVDKDPDQIGRTIRNAAAHQVYVHAACDDAHTAITNWSKQFVADSAFIGGGGDDALNTLIEVGVGRIVIALAAIDRVIPVVNILEQSGYGVKATQLNANRLERLSNGQRRLAAQNPVTVIAAEKLVTP